MSRQNDRKAPHSMGSVRRFFRQNFGRNIWSETSDWPKTCFIPDQHNSSQNLEVDRHHTFRDIRNDYNLKVGLLRNIVSTPTSKNLSIAYFHDEKSYCFGSNVSTFWGNIDNSGTGKCSKFPLCTKRKARPGLCQCGASWAGQSSFNTPGNLVVDHPMMRDTQKR